MSLRRPYGTPEYICGPTLPTLKRGANKLCAYGADSAAEESGCRFLLSEDMQDGFIRKGVPVVSPFGKVRHSLLGALLVE